MPWQGWALAGLALLEGGWFTFDGWAYIVLGRYIIKRSGRHAGKLAMWAKLVSAVGIDPKSSLVKFAPFLLGIVWVLVLCGYVGGPSVWSWWGMLICAIAGIWYLPFGTLLSIIQIVLLFQPELRFGAGDSF